MYVLTISDATDTVFDTRVYGDDTDLVSIIKSFTMSTLTSIVKRLMGEQYEPTKTTYARCGGLIEQLTKEVHASDDIVLFFEKIQNAPARVERALIDLEEYRQSDEFEDEGDEFYDDGIFAVVGGLCEYYVNWTLDDDYAFRYEVSFEGLGINLHILLERREQFDTL